MKDEVDKLFLDLLRGEWVPRRGPAAFRPNADVYYHQRDRAVVVRLELPGIDPDRITLEIEGGVLHVRGVRSDQRPPDAVYHQMEISYGRFERALTLPPEVEAGKASARYNRGYLEITLPVKQRSARRQIPIGSGGREGPGGPGRSTEEREEQ
jgi:HSP20 family protein